MSAQCDTADTQQNSANDCIELIVLKNSATRKSFGNVGIFFLQMAFLQTTFGEGRFLGTMFYQFTRSRRRAEFFNTVSPISPFIHFAAFGGKGGKRPFGVVARCLFSYRKTRHWHLWLQIYCLPDKGKPFLVTARLTKKSETPRYQPSGRRGDKRLQLLSTRRCYQESAALKECFTTIRLRGT